MSIVDDAQHECMQCHDAFKAVLEVDVRGRHGRCGWCQSGEIFVTESKGVFCRTGCETSVRPKAP